MFRKCVPGMDAGEQLGQSGGSGDTGISDFCYILGRGTVFLEN